MRPVRLFDEETGQSFDFKSIADAARFLKVEYQELQHAFIWGRKCNGYDVTRPIPREVSNVEDEIESDMPRQELDTHHYARIGNKEFVAVKCEDKTNCTKCDIYKLAPPPSMIQSPLCYEYNCGTHKIVDICAKYKCIWKRKKRNENRI